MKLHIEHLKLQIGTTRLAHVGFSKPYVTQQGSSAPWVNMHNIHFPDTENEKPRWEQKEVGGRAVAGWGWGRGRGRVGGLN